MLRPSLAVLLLAVATPVGAQAPATPEALVKALYARYGDGGMGLADPEVVALLTPATRTLLEAAMKRDAEEVAIEADPFCDCQDFAALSVGEVAVSAASADRATARVWISDRENPQRREIALELRCTAQGWRIEDAGPVGGWSLLKQLKTTGAKR